MMLTRTSASTHPNLRIPAARLFHIEGTPRENFAPRVVVSAERGRADAALDAAVRLLGSD